MKFVFFCVFLSFVSPPLAIAWLFVALLLTRSFAILLFSDSFFSFSLFVVFFCRLLALVNPSVGFNSAHFVGKWIINILTLHDFHIPRKAHFIHFIHTGTWHKAWNWIHSQSLSLFCFLFCFFLVIVFGIFGSSLPWSVGIDANVKGITFGRRSRITLFSLHLFISSFPLFLFSLCVLISILFHYLRVPSLQVGRSIVSLIFFHQQFKNLYDFNSIFIVFDISFFFLLHFRWFFILYSHGNKSIVHNGQNAQNGTITRVILLFLSFFSHFRLTIRFTMILNLKMNCVTIIINACIWCTQCNHLCSP